jgi:MOSC domain-containing protein YiiM
VSADLDLRSVAAALALMVGARREEVPVPEPGSDPVAVWREWLAVRNLGLVPVRDPAAFTWPGHFLAVIRAGQTRRGVAMFGVPPGVVHDPAGGDPGEVEQAWVVAALDRSLSGPKPYGEPPRTVGRLEAIAVASGAGREPRLLDRVRAIPGHGLEGDRYSTGDGTFSGGTGDGRALTLIEAEVLDSLAPPGGAPLGAVDARRNLVTRGVPLKALVGRRFTVGEVECEGRRLCEPCAHLERLTQPGVLRGLVHRGGLRADILSAGTIEVGAAVRPLD